MGCLYYPSYLLSLLLFFLSSSLLFVFLLYCLLPSPPLPSIFLLLLHLPLPLPLSLPLPPLPPPFLLSPRPLTSQLYNIVVDTEETGKQLLQKGQLKRRYTIIPLNKISARTISNDVVKKAQALVGGALNYR